MYFKSNSHLVVAQELKLRNNFNSINCYILRVDYVSDIIGSTGDKMMNKTHFCLS